MEIQTGRMRQRSIGTPRRPNARMQAAANVPGPVFGTRITEEYARMIAREAFFWAWPMVNLYNRRLACAQMPEPALVNGVVPAAPLNRMAMLHDYIEPTQRWAACPNQDVVYGSAIAALDVSPAVLQVPDFGKRFWVYQLVDLRTDSFADIGAMYATKPGFYLIVGPEWEGRVPAGITDVLRAPTHTAMVVPRIYQDDTAGDKQAVQKVLGYVDMYPVAEYDGKIKRRDWSTLPTFSPPASEGEGETRWVFPEKFFEQLPHVLTDAPALAGEEARYVEVMSVIADVQSDPALKRALVDEATAADKSLVDPLLQFRNYGVPLANNWTTANNGAQFGSDYFMRTAIARSNILVNKPAETKYLYQDLDDSGIRLNGASHYTVTFRRGELPPVKGFWSLTLYDRFHFFVPNKSGRYSVGTKNRELVRGTDGSLTIYVQPDAPADSAQRANWLPSPAGEDFSLYIRAYWPLAPIVDNKWTPPAVTRTAP